MSAERLGHSPGDFTVLLLFHKHLLPVKRPVPASPAMVYGLRHLSKGKSGTQHGLVPEQNHPTQDHCSWKSTCLCDGFMVNRTFPSLPPARVTSQGHASFFSQQSPSLLGSPFSLPKGTWAIKQLNVTAELLQQGQS